MRLDRRKLLELGGSLALVAIAGCVQAPQAGDSGPTSPSTPTPERKEHIVEANDELKFDPEVIEISAGDTIVWENVGSAAHTVTAYGDKIPEGAAYFASGGFESESAARDGFPEGGFEEGETYEHTFETEGQYEYFCIPHEQTDMRGSVTVV